MKLARSTTKKTKRFSNHLIIGLEIKKISTAYKKVDCPVVLSVKKILTFPLFKIEKYTRRRRTEAAKKSNHLGKAAKNEEFK